LRRGPPDDTRALVAAIATIDPRDATGETRDVYRYMAHVGGGGRVANVIRLFSARAASMRRAIRSWELAMWMGDEPRAQREFLAVAVSRLNECHY
jgi:hypothetical protein